MKRLNTLFFVVVALITLLHTEVQAQTASEFRQWGHDIYDKIQEDYRIPNSYLYYENPDHGAVAFAWDLVIMFKAHIYRGNDAQNYLKEYNSRFWCFKNSKWGFSATADNCGDRYYDDNAGWCKGILELGGNINQAKEIMNFVMTGEYNNSIIWLEGGPLEESASATPPSILCNAKLYNLTGIQQYKDDAERLWTWIRTYHWGTGYGYRACENAISVLGAIELYKATGKSQYYDDALDMAKRIESTYIDASTGALKETGQWGGHHVTDAYVELYKLTGDRHWIDVVKTYLVFLHEKCKDSSTGRYPEYWNDTNGPYPTDLLYQASVCKAFYRLADALEPTEEVTLSEDCNYDGYNISVGVGEYSQTELNSLGVINNDVSSLNIPSGFEVELYDDDNFEGSMISKSEDDDCLDDDAFNNQVSSARIVRTGNFYIQNRFSGLYLDVDSTRITENGANVDQWEYKGKTHQQFTFNYLGDGIYSIINVASGKAIEVADYSTSNGANIQQRDYVGNANQQFRIVNCGHGYFKIIVAHSDKLIENAGWNKSNGGNIQQWEDADQISGQWKLIKEDESYLDGTYLLQNRNSGLYLDVDDAHITEDGANIQQWEFSNNESQEFQIKYVGDGAYSIINVKSGKSVEIKDGSYDNGANVQQGEYTGIAQQLFSIVSVDNTYFKVRAIHSNKLIEVSGFNMNNGGNIQQWEDANQTSGHWILEKTEKDDDTVTGIEENTSMLHEDVKVILYPNPTIEVLNVSSKNLITDVSVYNMIGKKVISVTEPHGSKSIKLDVSGLSKGMYIATIQGYKGAVISKYFMKI